MDVYLSVFSQQQSPGTCDVINSVVEDTTKLIGICRKNKECTGVYCKGIIQSVEDISSIAFDPCSNPFSAHVFVNLSFIGSHLNVNVSSSQIVTEAPSDLGKFNITLRRHSERIYFGVSLFLIII